MRSLTFRRNVNQTKHFTFIQNPDRYLRDYFMWGWGVLYVNIFVHFTRILIDVFPETSTYAVRRVRVRTPRQQFCKIIYHCSLVNYCIAARDLWLVNLRLRKLRVVDNDPSKQREHFSVLPVITDTN